LNGHEGEIGSALSSLERRDEQLGEHETHGVVVGRSLQGAA
jgi:hypothetical protein